MRHSLNEETPIFNQICQMIEDEIIRGHLPEGEQAPSTNQLAAFYRINPATVMKGINLLVDEEILYKKRGIGMFVAEGAKRRLMDKRKTLFYQDKVTALLEEADKLGISSEEIINMIKGEVSNARNE